MIEKRYLRFASIAGIERRDLPVAAEIWLDEISKSSWATREIIQLATHFTRYIREPDPALLKCLRIERDCSIDKPGLIDSLRLMVSYGAAEGFEIDGDVLLASLSLSYLQRLRVLEVKCRFTTLGTSGGKVELPWYLSEEKWLEQGVTVDDEALEETVDAHDGTPGLSTKAA